MRAQTIVGDIGVTIYDEDVGNVRAQVLIDTAFAADYSALTMEVDSIIPVVDYRTIRLNGRYVLLPMKGMRIDLGSIGKGWAIEHAQDGFVAHPLSPVDLLPGRGRRCSSCGTGPGSRV